MYVVKILLIHRANYVKISAKLLFFMLRDINLCSILDIAGDSLPTLVEYFSMAASTLVPRVIFLLYMVLIMKMKSKQCIKAEIQAKKFQWILKAILWRDYYSIKGLEKATVKDFWHNMGELQCHL